MESSQLLLEYLKEQYAQARQHETRQTNKTAFLTAASGVIIGIILKDGFIRHDNWWLGAVIVLIGLANLWINQAHQSEIASTPNWQEKFETRSTTHALIGIPKQPKNYDSKL